VARPLLPESEHKAWIAQVTEPALEPNLVICDAHHHLWLDEGHTGWAYPLEDFLAHTGSGHKVAHSVYLECGAQYHRNGPQRLQPVGETAWVAGEAIRSAALGGTELRGIVGHADLRLGDSVEEVLDAHSQAGNGLFCGIRYTTAQDSHPALSMRESADMNEPAYLAGVRKLGELGYTYDAMVYHPQLTQLVSVARNCPQTSIVINHLGGFLGVGPYRDRREEVLDYWYAVMNDLAACPNTFLKLGGIGMPMMGFRWDKQEKPPGSRELSAAWGDAVQRVIDIFSPGRCLFESNYPVDMRGAGYGVLWNSLKRMTIQYSESERRDLFHDSAFRAYRLTAA